MGRLLALLAGLCSLAAGGPDPDEVRVPAGRVEAVWLSPVPVKTRPKAQVAPLIKVRGFSVMTRPVTRIQFLQFVNKHSQWQADRVSRLFAEPGYLSDQANSPGEAPITNVSWFAARAYCANRGMRLPMVDEWEYMAAASESKRNANSDEVFLRRILDWYGEPRNPNAKLAGSVYRNLYGIWDLHGNIWEWVEDFNSTFVTGESREDGNFNKDMGVLKNTPP